MHPARWLVNKAKWEWQGLAANARYALTKPPIAERLARRMPTLSLELTNVCNANCVFCAYQFQTRATGVMPEELFRKVVDEFDAAGGGGVNLTPTVGDPLVDPHLVERIAYIRSKPSVTGIGMYSNMISLERFGAGRLIDAGLTSLVVSMSGPDEQMYLRVYRSKMYKKVIRNVLAFAEENNRRGRPVNFFVDLRVDRSLAEVARAPDFARLEKAVGKSKIGVKRRYDNWAGKVGKQDLLGTMRLRKPPRFRRPRISPCSELFTGPMVFWDGKVGACGCRDVDARELIIGNALTQTLSEIWFGPEIAKLRSDFLTPQCKEICQNCSHYNNIAIYLRPDMSYYGAGESAPAEAGA